MAGDSDTQTREDNLRLRETELVFPWRAGSKRSALMSVPGDSLTRSGRDGAEGLTEHTAAAGNPLR